MLLWLSLVGCIDPDAPVSPGDDAEFVFEVPKGSSASGLGGRLTSEGLVASEFSWKMFLRGTDGSCLKAGKFKVRRSLSMNELLETLCGVPLADEVPFTVVEGWRIREIDQALAAKGFIQRGEYEKVVTSKSVTPPFEITGDSLEGYLYPETYQVPEKDFDVNRFVERQLQTFKTRFLDVHGDQLGDRTLDEVVIMASMLEREEPKPVNRPLVSGILWKRIDSGWALGVDATSRYTLENWNDRKAFLKKLRDPDDPYNTRLKKGLPPTAIGNPNLDSLKAAISPKASEFWYYLHDSKGDIHPARDGKGHEANRAKYNVY